MSPAVIHARVPILSAATAVLLAFAGCASLSAQSFADAQTPLASIHTGITAGNPAGPGKPFSTVIVLGDSISAGFQNGSLLGTQQGNGWASLLAQQAGFKLTLPLVAAPGVPPVYTLVQGTLPPVLQQGNGFSIGRDNPGQQVDNLAVPGHRLYDLLHTSPVEEPADTTQRMTSLVLGYPAGTTGTAVQQAIARQPSTIYLWIGGNDALRAMGTSDPHAMTPLSTFSSEFTQLMATLKAGTNAHLIVANLPDATKIPYMTQAAEVLYECQQYTGIATPVFSALFRIYPGDLLNWQGLADVHANMDRVAANQYPMPVPTNEVLTAAEVVQIQGTIDSYNTVIAQQVAAAGATLVDMHGYIDSLAKDGVTINGYKASTLYLGGIFGLDGIHPTSTGYALIANQFIASTNTALGTSIPPVDVGAIAAKDLYFGPNRQNSFLPYAQQHISRQAGQAADALMLGEEQGH